jgi:DNA-binding XRE family transcriptional regulator/mannose-6-phosphate isomerase-like protein (cupin superfamily)
VPAEFDVGAGLGPRLRQVRRERGLSVRELARRIGCSASLISQIERGLSAPSVGIAYSMATELRTSLDYLFGVESGAIVHGGGNLVAATGGASAPGGAGAAGPGRAGVTITRHAGTGTGIVQRAGTRRVIDLASGVRWERLTAGTDATADFLEVIYSPGGHSTDQRRPLRHDGHEYGVILSGTLQANVGFETYELGPGDSISFDSSIPHEYWNTTDDYVRAIWAVVHTGPGRA